MTDTRVVRALGAMSGTSLDGVDAAIIETDGERVTGFCETAYRPYSDDEREILRAALGAWPEDDVARDAAEVVENAHAEVLSEFGGVDVIGFHGQTLAHDPAGRGTHQAGNGALLAEVLEVPVVWDFRTADVAMGGQGAPLAPFYHHALARSVGAQSPVAVLNMGGVGNLTWIDPRIREPQADGALLAFDTGPANAPLDDLMRSRRGLAFDEGGQLAAAGSVDEGVLAAALRLPFFAKMPPKSLDRNDFQSVLDAVDGLSDADAAATLTAFSVDAVVAALNMCPQMPDRLWVTGGGRKNPAMMARLSERCPVAVEPVEAVGFDGDMLEAQAFAFLAVRVMRGLPTSAPGTTGVAAPLGGGTVSRPGALAHLGISNPGAASSNPSN